MGELAPTQRIIDVVKNIKERKYQLPSIQRPFVWEEEQILRLVDSLMCSYPIGAVMVWKPSEKIRCRQFLDSYSPGDRLISQLPAPSEQKAYMVLDGQQRLQSLYICFFGQYDGRKLYLRIDKLADPDESNLNYELDFLKDDEAAQNLAWVHVNELIQLKVKEINRFVHNRLPNATLEEYDLAFEIITTFVQEFAMDQSLLFQEVDADLDYNHVLEVFERVNSGGTKLSKSDLLFSTVTLKIPDMEERFIRIVDDLNDGGRHSFNTDFIIKTAFIVFDKKAKYDFNKLRDDKFIESLANEFDHLEKVMTALRVWLDNKALIKAGRFLRSQLALIPIIDYLIMNKKYLGPSDGNENNWMKQYLYMSFFTRLYSRAPDSTLDQIHDILVKSHKEKPGIFPIKELGAFMAKREKKGEYIFRDEYLWDLDLVLNIIDGGVLQIPKIRAWSLERDHIFPKHQLELRKIKVDVNSIGNFRLEGKSRNISKSDNMPDANTDFFGKGEAELMKLYIAAYTNLNQKTFSAFVQKRKELIKEKVLVFLDM
ncbi:MAG: DUF262 domain-containing protein [Anaerolineaceae bacterium]